jgi:large subunit ribosomal protein L23
VTFKVLQDAETEIKAAVQLMFKVDVKAIACEHQGQAKRFGKSMGRRDNIRKAYVTLVKS